MFFDTALKDSQSTVVETIAPERFDVEAYAEYEALRLPRMQEFMKAQKGMLVYRRVRANGVFYDRCADYRQSLALQLGALQKSMDFEADVPNFLEPWYGIGYISSCFGGTYRWRSDQAPEVAPLFESAEEVLNASSVPIAQTKEGKYILETIEYFLDKTRGKLPISFSDVQSPLNMLGHLIPATNLFLEILDCPDTVKKAALKVSSLLIEFLKEQKKLIGTALANPGHGFASSRMFSGIGMSDDNSIMLDPADYLELFSQADEQIGLVNGGVGYHSCGNWSNRIDMVQSIPGVVVADGAFSIKTDPSPNDLTHFTGKLNSGKIVLNARAVGTAEEVLPIFQQLWGNGRKMIAVSYCTTPEEQKDLYQKLHALEQMETVYEGGIKDYGDSF